MEQLIVARHAESAFSVRNEMNGDPSIACPLTDAGVAQARRLAEAVRDDAIDLCVVTEFERTRLTAELALAGRDVPRLVVPELNDIRVGDFEGGPLEEYRAWAATHSPRERPPGGGESRADVAARFARGYRTVLARPERTILAVLHGLAVRYLLLAVEERDPAARVDAVEYATPYALTAAEVEAAAGRLEAWAADPVFA